MTKRVLIVEPDQDELRSLNRFIIRLGGKPEGCTSIFVNGAKQILERHGSEIAVILIDADGPTSKEWFECVLEFLGELKVYFPGRIIVIAESLNKRTEILDAGCQVLVQKGWDMSRILQDEIGSLLMEDS